MPSKSGRVGGSKNAKRTPLVDAPRGVVTSTHIELARRLAMAQLREDQIATALGVSESTLKGWAAKIPALRQALHEGRHHAAAPVIASLFENARKREVIRKKVVTLSEGGGVTRAKVVSYRETVDADTRAATHILAVLYPDKWALGKARTENDDGDNRTHEERARCDAWFESAIAEARAARIAEGLPPDELETPEQRLASERAVEKLISPAARR
jgi:hypothetical protein